MTDPSATHSLRAPQKEFSSKSHQRMANETDRGVTVKKGESVDRALKRLKSKLDSEGIMEEIRRRRAFETPAGRKRRKARSAAKRHRVRWRYVSEYAKSEKDKHEKASSED